MSEQENIKNEEVKQEAVTPNQTGEVVQHEVETPEATEESAKEVSAEEKPSEEVVEVSDEDGQDDKDVREESGENKTDTEQLKSDDETTDDSSEEIQSEEEVDEPVEEQEQTEKDSKETEEQSVNEDDIEAIKKELAELKAEKEDEARERELVDVAQNVEVEYDRVVKGINEALRETLEQYQIPTDKTIQELEKEDPAKAQIARNLIAQAKQVLDYNTQMLSNEYRTKEQDVIFSKAERLFNKYEMTTEEQQIAAETFIQILHASGLQDLKEDLAAKVELSVAQAKFRVPAKTTEKVEQSKEVTEESQKVKTEPAVEPEKADEKVNEEEVSKSEEKPEEKAPESPTEEFKLERGVAKKSVTKKVSNNLDAFKEGIDGTNSNAAAKTSTVDVTNVLSKLAALPPKERQKFTKENFALINEAMRKFNIEHSRKV